MSKKKKPTRQTEKRDVRLRKARQWIQTYDGQHIVRAYRKKFGVDVTCALKELGELGVLTPEQIALKQKAEDIRLEQKQREREKKARRAFYDRFPDSDDNFFFIAGYTPGGAPYGVTWAEMGLEPWTLPEDYDD